MIRALVIGYGSIGRRHARILKGLGCEVAIVSRSASPDFPRYAGIAEALSAFLADYVVVANETDRHFAAVFELAEAGYVGKLLVEKPVFETPRPLPPHQFCAAAVAYNLRFHPVVLALKQRLEGQHVLAVEAYAGQWLPSWRPESDYRNGYSALRSSGGGVLRDLSHELDLLTWMFGPWLRLAALGGHKSKLAIESDDMWTVLFEMQSGASATLHLNYLDKPGRRRLLVITDNETIVGDLTAGTLEVDGARATVTLERDQSYIAEHTAMLQGREAELCSLEDGLGVLTTVRAIEQSSTCRAFVTVGAA